MQNYFMRIIDKCSGQELSFSLEDGNVVVSGDLPPRVAFELGMVCLKMSPHKDVPVITLVHLVKKDDAGDIGLID